MDTSMIGIIGIVIMIVLMFVGMPIGFAMALTGLMGLMYLQNWNFAFSTAGIIPFSAVFDFNKLTVPLFLLMSAVAYRSGMAEGGYKAANAILGRIRGGLAIATTMGCGAFAAICGSSVATSAAIGQVALPEMKRYGYDTKLAIGSITAGGTVGIMIPPSIGFIIYSILTGESVGRLFMAGFLPGILQVIFYIGTISILCWRNPKLGPPGTKTDLKTTLKATSESWPMIFLFVLVLGGIYLGVFTAMEAGALGAFFAAVIGIISRKMSGRNFVEALLETGRTTGMIFMLIVGAYLFNNFLTLTNLGEDMGKLVTSFGVNRYVILFAILILYIILGCIMDVAAALFLTVPIIYPIILALNFDPIWYGVLMVRILEIGELTPPIGLNCFVMASMTNTPLYTVFRAVTPFIITDFFHLALLAAIPEISLWLPGMMVNK
jgi:tripartite ATP-independent transporter DctM subunit